MFFKDKLLLLNYLFLENRPNAFESKLRNIFNKKILEVNKKTAIVLYEEKERRIFVLKNQQWKLASFEEERLVNLQLNPKEERQNKYIGFIDYDARNREYVFKTRNTREKIFKGACCDEMGKSNTIELLNEITDTEEFTKDNTKTIKATATRRGRPPLVQNILCIILELYMRHYDRINKDDCRWFYDTEEIKIEI
jgi:hypothetical protein